MVFSKNRRPKKCDTKKCHMNGKDLFVYSDGVLTIGICYSCGMFDGTGTDTELLHDFVSQPETILELIATGELARMN